MGDGPDSGGVTLPGRPEFSLTCGALEDAGADGEVPDDSAGPVPGWVTRYVGFDSLDTSVEGASGTGVLAGAGSETPEAGAGMGASVAGAGISGAGAGVFTVSGGGAG